MLLHLVVDILIKLQQLLDNKKYHLDEFELKKHIRRVVATQLARDGSVQKSGGSANSVLMNIHRQGLHALHRKEFNFHTKLRNLKIQRNNIALETQSKNNALFNTLKGFPSATGLALSIGGSALQTGIAYKEGRTTSSSVSSASDYGPAYMKGSLKQNVNPTTTGARKF